MIRTNDRRILASLLVAATTLFGVAWVAPVSAQEKGLPGLAGDRLSERDLAEGATIVVVWASWSPRSRDLGERLAAIDKRWGKRARVISVNFQETPDKARAFVEGQKLRVPVYLDRDANFAKRHAVTSLPFLLVLVDGKTGFAGKLPADVDAAIGRALE